MNNSTDPLDAVHNDLELEDLNVEGEDVKIEVIEHKIEKNVIKPCFDEEMPITLSNDETRHEENILMETSRAKCNITSEITSNVDHLSRKISRAKGKCHLKPVCEKVVGYHLDKCKDSCTPKKSFKEHRRNFRDQIKSKRLDHAKSTRKPELKHFRCDKCTFVTSSTNYNKQQIQRHERDIHQNVPDFNCLRCSYGSNVKEQVMVHSKDVHDNLEEYLMSFENESNKKSHKEYKCDLCNYKTDMSNTLIRHHKAIHAKIKDVICDECTFATNTSRNLIRHIMAVHRDIKPVVCNYCGKRYIKNSDRDQHIKTVHQNIKDHLCEQCGYVTARPQNLAQHIKTVHRNDLQ